MIGDTLLNRYKIESELGKGGMGVVYQAHDILLNRAVAIKFVNTEGVGTEGKARLLQEARAAARLNHPNIVSVYDAGESDGNPFIVMELVDGKTLRHHEIQDMLEALNTTQDICKALEHAHTRGIIHRDLKLENIIITESQTIKLMDFGLARTSDQVRATEEGTIFGTFAYLAPELIQGGAASLQSDLYALGVIMYELLTGMAPFRGTISEIIAQHLHGIVTPPSEHNLNVPAWVDELVLRILSKHPEERPASAKDVLLILEQKSTPPAVTSLFSIASKPKNNLPSQLTSFIGREKEIDELKQALDEHRLVTLTGSGGTGKTRLTMQVAAELLDRFDHGVWFVELAPLADPDLIPQTIVSAIGISEQPNKTPLDILKEYLHDKKVLIVLDNCEHLVTASAQVVNTLLNAAPGFKVLASSREALGVKGELSYPVPSLSLPDLRHLPPIEQLSQYEAVRLFIDRAQLVAPHFVMDINNAPFVAQICQRLDGIPLAIELASARIKMLPVDQIAVRLDDRFRLLTGGARTALPRQQTLRALIDWSYDILSDNERLLLRRLSVFSGGWTLEAAEEVTSDSDQLSVIGDAATGYRLRITEILDLLSQLVNKSLVIIMEGSQSGETRYRMLETIRQYAREKFLEAGGGEAIRQRHLAYFVNLAEQAEPELYRSNQVFWLNKLDDDLENLRLAMEWAMEIDVESGLRIAAIPWRFWQARGYYRELGEWLAVSLERYTTVDVRRVQALVIYAETVFFVQSNISEAIGLAEKSLQMARELSDPRLEAHSLSWLGCYTQDNGNVERGCFLLEESLVIYRALGDKIGQADVLMWLSGYVRDKKIDYCKESLILHRELGNLSGISESLRILAGITLKMGGFSSITPWLEESLTISRQLGNHASALVLRNFGDIAYWQGNYRRAIEYYKESLILCEITGNQLLYIFVHINMAYAILRQGDFQQARGKFEICLRDMQKAGSLSGVVYCIEGVASLIANHEQANRATRLFAWADAVREKMGDHRLPLEQDSIEKDLAVIHSKIDDTEFARLSTEGRSMTMEQAIQLALN